MRKLFCFLFFCSLLLPMLAEACSMCQGSYSEKTITAYKSITLLLALLPILGGGGIFYWIYSKNKKIEETQDNL